MQPSPQTIHPHFTQLTTSNIPIVIKAAIDVGSNSVLLLVANLNPDGTSKTIYEHSTVTGLGQNTKTTGLLAPDRIRATLQAIKTYYTKAQELKAQEVLAGATMAARIATNTPDFLQAAQHQNTPIIVLSGEDEANLGFLAVAQDPIFAQASRITIIDPGGHSTEIQTADRTPNGWHTRLKKSYSIGALGLREGPLANQTPTFADRLNAVDQIDTQIGFEFLPRQCGTVAVLGATGTNLVSIRDNLTTWQPEKVHNALLDFEEISRATGWLCDMTDQERSQVPGLEPGREKTIHIGGLILERFLQATHALECRVSVRGWRHALLENGWPQDS